MKIVRIIVFIVLASFVGFCTGMFIGAYVSRNVIGIDASINTLGYGMGAAVISLISSIFLVRVLNVLWFRRVFLAVCLLSVIMAGFITYRVLIENKNRKKLSTRQIPVYNSTNNAAFHFASYKKKQEELPIGTGMAQPHLIPGKTLYFYGYNAIYSMPEDLTPVDSVTFKKGQHFIEIATAPPWLVPEVLKLDYNTFYFRTLTVSKNWLEVVVNNTNGQTAWISHDDAEFFYWHSFLLNVAAVELIDEEKNPLRLKPLDHAGILATTPARFQLTPLAIQGDWIMVSTNGLADRIPPAGWIRWRDGNKILIRYSILS